ncbi:transcription initiation factor IIB [Thermoproteus tenax]|uniref:Transcription initiation factor IIB n=2 Tax=Thermoproteus tenax TaxID=2271 RepID=G4RKL9_THETK|nr:transcription initiation factor IIB [Thermoproteus tenax]CAP46908.1 transcription initiation factor IIB [Thermoproteus tenax Kra 1]CCC82114.1 transcription initiation factor B [Thermoproteus tenax Kra 1]
MSAQGTNQGVPPKLRIAKSSDGYLSLITETGEPYVCPVCGNDKFVYNYERGEIVCVVCGTVISENLVDLGPEWRAFTNEEKGQRARTGAPITRLVSEALTTVIDWRDRDVSGKELDLKRKLEVIRLRKWQTRARVQTSYERNFVQAAQELERLKSSMGVPRPCVEQALEIYRQALEKELVRGRSVEAMAAAALYMACRMLKTPRPLDELIRYTKASRREVARCYRLLLRELNVRVPISDPVLYISRVAEQLKLTGDVVKTAIDIINRAKKAGLTAGKDPAGLAAAAVYIASLLHGDNRTQKDFAVAAGVTEVTVRNRYKELAKALDIKIPVK